MLKARDADRPIRKRQVLTFQYTLAKSVDGRNIAVIGFVVVGLCRALYRLLASLGRRERLRAIALIQHLLGLLR